MRLRPLTRHNPTAEIEPRSSDRTTRSLWLQAASVFVVAAAAGSTVALAPSFGATPDRVQAVRAPGALHAVDASVHAASRTAAPSSSKEVVLSGKNSRAWAHVHGGGRASITVAGVACQGDPVLTVTADGHRLGRVTVPSSSTYATHVVGHRLPAGEHRLGVRLVNQHHTSACRRAVLLTGLGIHRSAGASPTTSATTTSAAKTSAAKTSAAKTPAAKTPAAKTPAAKTPAPGSSTPAQNSGYGVPAGTKLTVHTGDVVITKPGTVIDGWDIRGDVQIKADNVTIRNSVIRGGAAPTKTTALIEAWWKYQNIHVERTTLRADNPSIYVDGMSGSNITATGLDISNVVDGVKFTSSNMALTNSHIHDLYYSSNDPTHSDGHTHNDGVQVQGGTNFLIQDNVIEGAANAAIMVTQDAAATGNLTVKGNELSNGACTINVSEQGAAKPIKGMSITGNRFGPGSYGKTCPMRLPSTSPITVTGNTWKGSNAPANAGRY